VPIGARPVTMVDMTSPTTVLTFGHGTADAAVMTDLLRGAGVAQLVDVRTAPGSRHNPDATRAVLAERLPAAGIGYRWDKRLGGWRRPLPDSPDTALRARAFSGYAGHMRTPEFRTAIDELVAGAAGQATAVMCAETVWWRCHRKLIADFLVLVRHIDVRHLMHDGMLRPHRPSPEARLLPDQAVLVYDAGQEPLLP
jgi:uncharacterized protein (DUF488 family)